MFTQFYSSQFIAFKFLLLYFLNHSTFHFALFTEYMSVYKCVCTLGLTVHFLFFFFFFIDAHFSFALILLRASGLILREREKDRNQRRHVYSPMSSDAHH